MARSRYRSVFPRFTRDRDLVVTEVTHAVWREILVRIDQGDRMAAHELVGSVRWVLDTADARPAPVRRRPTTTTEG